MRRWVFALLPLLVLLGLIGWRVTQKQAEAADRVAQKEARKNAPVTVQTVPVTRRDVVTTVEAVGTVEPSFSVELRPEVTGKLLTLSLREGDRVNAGQVVATIETPDLIGNVRRAEANLAESRARLVEAELTADPTTANLTANVQQQEAALATAQAQLQQARATAEARVAVAEAAVADARTQIEAAEAQIATADAAITTTQSRLTNARVRRERQETLVAKGISARQLFDDAKTAEDAASGAVQEAQQQKETARAARRAALARQESAEKNVVVVRNQVKADVAVATAAVAQARATLRAARVNTARTPAYARNLEALRASVRFAEADLRTARNRLDDATVRSPMNAVVARRYVDPGALVSPTQSLLSLQALRTVWITISVPEEIARRLQVGQVGNVTFDALPAEKGSAKIVRIEPAVDTQSRQFLVRLQRDNPGERLKPGMFARAILNNETASNVLTLPREAITRTRESGSDEEKTTVAVLVDGKVQIRPVTTGLSDGNVFVITEGLQENELAIVPPGRPLKEGQPVKSEGSGLRTQ